MSLELYECCSRRPAQSARQCYQLSVIDRLSLTGAMPVYVKATACNVVVVVAAVNGWQISLMHPWNAALFCTSLHVGCRCNVAWLFYLHY